LKDLDLKQKCNSSDASIDLKVKKDILKVKVKEGHLAFLSMNYKSTRYYWEFVRMGERLLFIVLASLLISQ
jgi:hypothetical protein